MSSVADFFSTRESDKLYCVSIESTHCLCPRQILPCFSLIDMAQCCFVGHIIHFINKKTALWYLTSCLPALILCLLMTASTTVTRHHKWWLMNGYTAYATIGFVVSGNLWSVLWLRFECWFKMNRICNMGITKILGQEKVLLKTVFI